MSNVPVKPPDRSGTHVPPPGNQTHAHVLSSRLLAVLNRSSHAVDCCQYEMDHGPGRSADLHHDLHRDLTFEGNGIYLRRVAEWTSGGTGCAKLGSADRDGGRHADLCGVSSVSSSAGPGVHRTWQSLLHRPGSAAGWAISAASGRNCSRRGFADGDSVRVVFAGIAQPGLYDFPIESATQHADSREPNRSVH